MPGRYATAIVAFVGNDSNFQHARDLSGWIGIVPSPSLSFVTTALNGIIDLGRYRGVYGTTFV